MIKKQDQQSEQQYQYSDYQEDQQGQVFLQQQQQVHDQILKEIKTIKKNSVNWKKNWFQVYSRFVIKNH